MSTKQALFEIANTDSLQEYISQNLYDPWIDTPFKGYRYMDNKQKGELGERYATLMLEHLGHNVEMPHSSTAGYDRIVNGIKTEIKFSLAHTDNKKKCLKKDMFTLNHVSHGKDWERLLFVGINREPEDMRIGWMTKEDFSKACSLYFGSQQGGKKVQNDDYLCAGKNLIRLIESEYMNDITEW